MGEYISNNNQSIAFVMLVLLFNCIRLVGLLWFFLSQRIHVALRAVYFSSCHIFCACRGADCQYPVFSAGIADRNRLRGFEVLLI